MTTVEWLEDCLTEQYPNGKFVWNTRADIEALFKRAKEMEKQQQDNFAIGFAEWLFENCDSFPKEDQSLILRVYKKEKGL